MSVTSTVLEPSLLKGDTMLKVTTYTPVSGIKSARIEGVAHTILITRDRWKSDVWECWYSDGTRTIMRGSFRSCVSAARRRLNARP